MVEKKSTTPAQKVEASPSVLEQVYTLASDGLTIHESHGHGDRLVHTTAALEAIEKLVASHLGITSEAEESA